MTEKENVARQLLAQQLLASLDRAIDETREQNALVECFAPQCAAAHARGMEAWQRQQAYAAALAVDGDSHQYRKLVPPVSPTEVMRRAGSPA